MRRTVLILDSTSLTLLIIAALFATLNQSTPATAEAALPANHPALGPNGVPVTAVLSTTTLLDFFQPGTQPNHITDTIDSPESCIGRDKNE